MRIAGMLLLLIMAPIGLYADEAALPRAEAPAFNATPVLEAACGQDLTAAPSQGLEAPLPASFFEPTQSACNCDTQCGVCGGRLRGCFNGIPICECFHC